MIKLSFTRAMLAVGVAGVMAGAAPLLAQDDSGNDDQIVVEAQLRKVEKDVETLSKAITRPPRSEKPISRQFRGVCVGVYGISKELAYDIIDRVESNARQLNIPVYGKGCDVNTLIAFTPNSQATVKRFRKELPWLFDTLLDYEYDRILKGTGAVQSWQATQLNRADGMPFTSAIFDQTTREPVDVNVAPRAGHIADQVRTDINGSIVIFDNAFVPGKSVKQLADYATMRLLAPTDDASDHDGDISTILSLFAKDGTPPDGLTDFDKAYLAGLYKLPANARASAVTDASWSAYRKDVYDRKAGTAEN